MELLVGYSSGFDKSWGISENAEKPLMTHRLSGMMIATEETSSFFLLAGFKMFEPPENYAKINGKKMQTSDIWETHPKNGWV